jgi:hypothetical protein
LDLGSEEWRKAGEPDWGFQPRFALGTHPPPADLFIQKALKEKKVKITSSKLRLTAFLSFSYFES